MIGYTTLGSNDLNKATAFYEALISEMGGRRISEVDGRMVIWGVKPGEPMFGVCTPYDGLEASAGNGTMIAIMTNSKEDVGRLHGKAIELGATDDGAPGPRGDDGFYGAYFRDFDGNKICFYCVQG